MVKANIIVLGDAPLVTGFQLAGLENSKLTTNESFQNDLEVALSDKSIGVIVVNERMLNEVDWKIKKKLDSIAYPVVVPIPDSSGESESGNEIRNLIKRALGFDLAKK